MSGKKLAKRRRKRTKCIIKLQLWMQNRQLRSRGNRQKFNQNLNKALDMFKQLHITSQASQIQCRPFLNTNPDNLIQCHPYRCIFPANQTPCHRFQITPHLSRQTSNHHTIKLNISSKQQVLTCYPMLSLLYQLRQSQKLSWLSIKWCKTWEKKPSENNKKKSYLLNINSKTN